MLESSCWPTVIDRRRWRRCWRQRQRQRRVLLLVLLLLLGSLRTITDRSRWRAHTRRHQRPLRASKRRLYSIRFGLFLFVILFIIFFFLFFALAWLLLIIISFFLSSILKRRHNSNLPPASFSFAEHDRHASQFNRRKSTRRTRILFFFRERTNKTDKKTKTNEMIRFRNNFLFCRSLQVHRYAIQLREK